MALIPNARPFRSARGCLLIRRPWLESRAKAAFDAGDFDTAENYANELLADAPSYPKDWKQQFSKLDQWAATVEGGGKPDFGANLRY